MAKVGLRLRVFKHLCEAQFDLNAKFKDDLNAKFKGDQKTAAGDLRASPLGCDKLGNAYWLAIDQEANLRVFKEDVDEETWELVADTKEQLQHLIAVLKEKGRERGGLPQ